MALTRFPRFEVLAKYVRVSVMSRVLALSCLLLRKNWPDLKMKVGYARPHCATVSAFRSTQPISHNATKQRLHECAIEYLMADLCPQKAFSLEQRASPRRVILFSFRTLAHFFVRAAHKRCLTQAHCFVRAAHKRFLTQAHFFVRAAHKRCLPWLAGKRKSQGMELYMLLDLSF